ncbi:thiolase family protein [Nocardioides oleivorans]|uniref:Thiolase family protein n=1 Tax=Nocardioides oleivorans TaxID=273676 RepID=A0A4V1RKQ2_9ACTN|nr:thiolase family protein [Nocardioides oleivorans]RYB93072.1 thiolase family protein [Nocardioides oleivorans]
MRAPLATIVGIGELTPRRSTDGESSLGLMAEAAALAVADAGLGPGDVDGLLVGQQYGEIPMHVPASVAEYLGLHPTMANVVDLGGASAAGMVWRAAAAIRAGMCEVVLCVGGAARPATGFPRSSYRAPIREYDVPFGASGANTTYAMIAQAHIDTYGTTPEELAEIAVRARANAQLNPAAIFHGTPITVDDVLASPMISTPIHLLEAVMEAAGASALVVVSPERAASLGRAGAHLLGAGEKVTHRALSGAPAITTGPLKDAMAQALVQAGVGLADLGNYQLYDCYTIVVGVTIEDLGLVAPGKFGPWLADHDFSPSGDFPMNTHGGQLGFSQCGLAGPMSHVVEAVRQLRGEAGERQVPDPRLSLVTGNGATLSEAAALVLGGTS